MFIFRVEHDRNVCTDPTFKTGGESLTGHGPHCSGSCWTRGHRPNFGVSGECPETLPTYYERCAVTAEQWQSWVTVEHYCQFLKDDCEGDEYCPNCPEENTYRATEGWMIVAYRIDDLKEGIDWRYDNNQVIFNPEFAVNMGVITYEDVCTLIDECLALKALTFWQ